MQLFQVWSICLIKIPSGRLKWNALRPHWIIKQISQKRVSVFEDGAPWRTGWHVSSLVAVSWIPVYVSSLKQSRAFNGNKFDNHRANYILYRTRAKINAVQKKQIKLECICRAVKFLTFQNFCDSQVLDRLKLEVNAHKFLTVMRFYWITNRKEPYIKAVVSQEGPVFRLCTAGVCLGAVYMRSMCTRVFSGYSLSKIMPVRSSGKSK